MSTQLCFKTRWWLLRRCSRDTSYRHQQNGLGSTGSGNGEWWTSITLCVGTVYSGSTSNRRRSTRYLEIQYWINPTTVTSGIFDSFKYYHPLPSTLVSFLTFISHLIFCRIITLLTHSSPKCSYPNNFRFIAKNSSSKVQTIEQKY